LGAGVVDKNVWELSLPPSGGVDHRDDRYTLPETETR
jgi:hypothetical protein